MVSSASSHLRAARQGTEIPKEHRRACYFHRKSHVRTLYTKPMPGKRMLGEERKDACRNTGNLPKGGYQGMTCSWKKIKKVNNCAGRSRDKKLWSSQGWRIGLLTLDLVPKGWGVGDHSCVCFFRGGVFCDIFLQRINFCLKSHAERGVPDALAYAPHQTQQVFGNIAFCFQLPPFME